MAKAVSFTVHPSALGAEFLTVSDAMRQILDLVGALEVTEAAEATDRKIVWRLTDAHTNSPPFSVTAEAFSRDPSVSVGFEAMRVTTMFSETIRDVLAGHRPAAIEEPAAKLLRAVLKRNLNGIGQTEIIVDKDDFSVVPANARAGLIALEPEAMIVEDKSRVEYGSIEGRVIGLTTHYNRPALIFLERLSGLKVVCTLTDDLAEKIGPSHDWKDVWEGRSLLIGGEVIYDGGGAVKKVNASFHSELERVDVPLSALKELSYDPEFSIREHIDAFWGEAVG